MSYHGSSEVEAGRVENTQLLGLYEQGSAAIGRLNLYLRDLFTHKYCGQQVPTVWGVFETSVVKLEAIIQPLGHTPGENVLDAAHPDGKHSVVLAGPKFIHLPLEL